MKYGYIEIYDSKKVKGNFGWRVIGKNGEQLARSSEPLASVKNLRNNLIKTADIFGSVRSWSGLPIIDTTKSQSFKQIKLK